VKFSHISDNELMSAKQLVEQLEFSDTLDTELLALQEYAVENNISGSCSSLAFCVQELRVWV